ncbi:MAPEG family protein [Falsiroseomonas sp. E2-1-a20]|uniref:MAPEG family protein n=1 Tax=Falsiroseomonas sp. E2-1-a20 TaxID=3239300 RepID=UPI003F3499C8
MLPVTAIYASLLAFGFILLSTRTIAARRRYGASLGTPHRMVERAVRAHGNFAEHVPLALILLALCEVNGLAGWALHALGLALLAARLAHAHGISREPELSAWRVFGTSLTLTVLGAAAAAGLGLAAAVMAGR